MNYSPRDMWVGRKSYLGSNSCFTLLIKAGSVARNPQNPSSPKGDPESLRKAWLMDACAQICGKKCNARLGQDKRGREATS